jgi:sugar/nucleoside kinase (ribokinase family)
MATALATCASLGLKTKYIGATGTDENGRRLRQELSRRGVDMSDAVIRDAPNQFAVILVDESSGERIVLWDRNERLGLRARELPEEAICAGRLVHVDDVDQAAAIRAAEIGRRAGLPVTSDIDRVNDQTEKLIASVTIPIFAEHVPEHVTGIKDPERALRKLRERHDGLLCVTLGARGAMALDGDVPHYSPGFRVHAVDTTGAGDVFRAGVIYALLQGWRGGGMLRFANAAAALSCTRAGAMTSVPTLREVAGLLATQLP